MAAQINTAVDRRRTPNRTRTGASITKGAPGCRIPRRGDGTNVASSRAWIAYSVNGMRRKVTFDEWFSIAILVVVMILLPLTGEGRPFILWTIGGMATLAIFAIRDEESRAELILLGFLLPISLVAVGLSNGSILHLTRQTIDPELLQMDHGFSTAIYRWTLVHGACHVVLGVVYYGLPMFGAFVLSVSPRRLRCAGSWIIAALIAPIFYIAFPAVGPAHLGDPLAARNCIPSLHMTWALICAVYIPRRLRWIGIVYALLTGAATLGLGEHYMIDLVVAVPYTLAVCSVPLRRLKVRDALRFSTRGAFDQATGSHCMTGEIKID